MRRECLGWTSFVSSRGTVNSSELAFREAFKTALAGSASRKIATAPGEERTVGLGEMGRSRSRTKSPSRRRHKSKHSRKRSKSREKHSNNKYSEKPKERSSKSRCVPFATATSGSLRPAHHSSAKDLDLPCTQPSCRALCVYIYIDRKK